MNFHIQYELTVPHRGCPPEDAIAIKPNGAAVFDGVTLLHQSPYPDPSPAAQAAVLGAETALDTAIQRVHPGEGPTVLVASFAAANLAISRLNHSLGNTVRSVDHLRRQYAAAVGALAVWTSDTLFYGQINDCGVMICRPDGRIIVDMITDKTRIGVYLERMRAKKGFTAGSPEEHVFVRSRLVNNQRAELDGLLLHDYVLTGQRAAVNGVHVGQMIPRVPIRALIYSDGFRPLLENDSVRRALCAAPDRDAAGQVTEVSRHQLGELSEASLVVGAIE